MIFALIACATGRCIQLMRLSLPRAQENAVDRHKWVESINNDDEGCGQIYVSFKKKLDSVLLHDLFLHWSQFIKCLFIRSLKSDL